MKEEVIGFCKYFVVATLSRSSVEAELLWPEQSSDRRYDLRRFCG
jgi:hypothetical protein